MTVSSRPSLSTEYRPPEPYVAPPVPEPATVPDLHARFRPDIEGLRAVAVLLVIAYHVGLPGVAGGFIGVDVFFVLSGYLITGLLAGEMERTGTVSLASFYARRARRLLPGAALMLLVTLLAALAVLTPSERSGLASAAIATTLYASNLWLMRGESEYFDTRSESNPLLHTWSLSVEEQFYVAWPLVVLLTLRARRSRRLRTGPLVVTASVLLAAATRVVHGWPALAILAAWPPLAMLAMRCAPRRRALSIVIATLTVLSLMVCVQLTAVRPPLAFYASPTRAWEFGLGAFASLLPAGAMFPGRRARAVAAWLGLATIIGTALLLTPATQFPGAVALIPVMATVTVLIAGSSDEPLGTGRLLGHSVMQRIGKLSYSWYLWHWPLLVLTGIAVPHAPLALRVACAGVSLVVAWAAHALVENRVRFSRTLGARPRATLALASSLMTVCVVGALALRAGAERAGRTPRLAPYSAASKDVASLYARQCLAGYQVAEVHACLGGDSSSARTVVLLGDSHAAHWFPAVDDAARARGLRVVVLAKVACPTARVAVYNPHLRRAEHECDAWREGALRWIAEHRPEVVLLVNSAGYVRDAERSDGFATLSAAEWRDGLHETLAALGRSGTRTLVLRDTPAMPLDVPACLARAAEHRWFDARRCVGDASHAVDRTVHEASEDAVRGLSGVELLDLTAAFCAGGACPAVRDGRVMYHDSNHLTASFARSLAPLVRDALDRVLAARG